MRSIARWPLAICTLAVVTLTTGKSTVAQTDDTLPYHQVISANPFGLLLDLFNAEYERAVSNFSTAGAGGSAYFGGDDYVNADVFWRYYPNGTPLNGWAFGFKVGVTKFGDEGAFLGAGFDVNRSWVLGKNDDFYVGIGFGLKRLYVSNDVTIDLKYIPTFRIVNVGYVF